MSSFYTQPPPNGITPGFFSVGNPVAPPTRSLDAYEKDRNNILGKTGFGDKPLFTDSQLKGQQEAFALEGLQEANSLNKSFFSQGNIDLIQSDLKQAVYARSNHKYIIDRQSDTELLVIMRGIYLEYSKYNPATIDAERRRLNKIVVDYATPRIISEIQQYKMYLRDSSSNLNPMALPVSTNTAGTKVMRPITDVLNPSGDKSF